MFWQQVSEQRVSEQQVSEQQVSEQRVSHCQNKTRLSGQKIPEAQIQTWVFWMDI